MFSTDGGHLERVDVTESDMKEKIQLFQQKQEAELERKILRGKATAEASIDPTQSFQRLPSFLNESFKRVVRGLKNTQNYYISDLVHV